MSAGGTAVSLTRGEATVWDEEGREEEAWMEGEATVWDEEGRGGEVWTEGGRNDRGAEEGTTLKGGAEALTPSELSFTPNH